MRYNEHHDQILQQSDKKVRQVLKDQYPKFRQFIKNWWAGESVKRITELRTQAAVNNIRVYATQYNPNTPGAVEVALPDKYLKFANLGWDYTYPNPPYTVNIQRESTGQWIYDIRVDEVGPWNTDDNYWDDNTKRRIYSKLCCTTQQLDPGIPESYAAYYEGYNNGKDQFGRNVANPAGIDLTPETAKKLGLAYLQNAWVIFTTDDFGGSNPEKLYKVIAGSFSDKQNALDREAYLESKGIECIIMQVTVSGKTYYRVQAGAYRERANAEARLQEVKDAGVTDAFIVYE
ncbi:SPOR domain-containing protein [Paenactinomyces guangxiensis]|nr:SPOR domain-containing protein [Paenactinomyces guangxiensis]